MATWGQAGSPPQFQTYLFPGDAVFEKVGQQNAFVLKFMSYDDKHFFWFQEPKKQLWTPFVQAANRIINEELPAAPAPAPPASAIVPQVQPAPTIPQQPAPVSFNPASALSQRAQYQAHIKKLIDQTPQVQTLIGEQLISILKSNPQSLMEHLPYGSRSVQGLQQNLRSAQFRQSVKNFDRALFQSQAQIMREMGLDTSVLGQKAFHDAFWAALLKWGEEQRRKG